MARRGIYSACACSVSKSHNEYTDIMSFQATQTHSFQTLAMLLQLTLPPRSPLTLLHRMAQHLSQSYQIQVQISQQLENECFITYKSTLITSSHPLSFLKLLTELKCIPWKSCLSVSIIIIDSQT